MTLSIAGIAGKGFNFQNNSLSTEDRPVCGFQRTRGPGKTRRDSEQTRHQGEPMPVAGCRASSHTRLSQAQLLFSAVFSENEGLAFVNMLLGWKDAHALSKL